jgi:hypothetical protein
MRCRDTKRKIERRREIKRERQIKGDAETHIERHAVRCRERSSVGGRELVLS